jgi:hypothetical protein
LGVSSPGEEPDPPPGRRTALGAAHEPAIHGWGFTTL